MRYALLLAAVIGCNAQTISSLTAEIQRAPTAALYADRAAAYLTAGDAREALADTDRALDRDALNVRALTLRAQANSKLGRFSAAVTDLSGAIALAPADAALYIARSEAYTAIGDRPRAQADRDEALRLDPGAIAALELGPAPLSAPAPVAKPPAPVAKPPAMEPAPPPAKSITVVTPPPAAPAPPDAVSADAHFQQAKALLDDNKPLEAIAELDLAIRSAPTNPIFFNTRGYAFYLVKDMKRALQDYDEAIRLNPEYLNATHNRAAARRAAGDIAGADADRRRETELSRNQR